MDALRRWRIEQGKDKLALGAEYVDHGFVFASTFGSPLHQSHLYQRFRGIMADAGLGHWTTVRVGQKVKADERRFMPAYSMYEATRHTFAAQLIEDGEPLEKVSRLLGHKDVGITDSTYSHHKPHESRSGSAKMQARYG